LITTPQTQTLLTISPRITVIGVGAMRAFRRLVGTWLLLPTLLAACVDRTVDTAAAGEEPQYGGTVVVAYSSDLRGLNPLVAGEKFAQEVNRFLLYLPLVRHAEDFSLEPVLAERWEMVGDTGVIFHLRRDVRWHDGRPTTARDVVFTFERAKDPQTAFQNSAYFALWTGVEAMDSFTVRFTFAPHMDALAGWVFLPIAPAHLLDSIPSARLQQAAFNARPVGNGPFRFVEFRQNDRWVFEANPDHPEALGGRPYIDRFVWRPIPNATAQVAELRAGTADIILAPPPGEYATLRNDPAFLGIERRGDQYANVIWNGRVPPLDDARVRQALGLGLDRQTIVQTLRAGFGVPASGPIAPSHWAHDTAVEPMPYAPDSARALLRAAGMEDRNGDGVLELPDGRPFEIELKLPANHALNRDLAELVRNDLSRIGVRINTRPTEWSVFVQDFDSPRRNFEAIQLGYSTEYRLNLRDAFHSDLIGAGAQFASYANPRVDSLLDGVSVARSTDEARPMYSEIQRILRDEQPWSFLYYYPDLVLLRQRLQNAEMDSRGVLVNVTRWWVRSQAAPAAPAGSDSAAHSQPPDSAPRQ
jgi:peptide/nickel transport system substrate-binding protein